MQNLSSADFKFEYRVPGQEYYQLLRVVVKMDKDIRGIDDQHYIWHTE